MFLPQSKNRGRARYAGIVVATYLLAMTTPASALTVADGDLRLDVPVDEAESCVLLPETSDATEGCDGLDRVALGKKLLAGYGKGVEPVSVILGRDEPFYVMTVVRAPVSETEFDRAGANEFARVIRARVGHETPAADGSPGAGEPWEERINGVQVIIFDATASSANDQGLNHHLFYVASTSRGSYTISFSCATEDAETVRAISREALSTLRALPAKPAGRRSDAAARAGAIGDAIQHGLTAVAELGGVALVIWAVVRHRKKAREHAGSSRQPPP
ncbi:MAG: hypothetical protein KF764_22120 [Labilithrix sp.]|nr:hypothetical protein [Labilithrix sp.]